MWSRFIKKKSLVLLTLFLSLQISAQVALSDLNLDHDVTGWFDQAIGYGNSGLLIGRYQEMGRNSPVSHPFFEQDVWTEISMKYRGEVYEKIYALYDVEQDIMVIRHPSDLSYHSQPIMLNQAQVDWFEMNGHLFRYFGEILTLPAGFMDVIYEGMHLNLYSKRIKYSRAEQTIVYTIEDRYIIELDGAYYRFQRLNSILRLFKEDRKTIRKFVRQNKLKIKRQNDQDLQLLAAFCDELLTDQ